MDTPRKFRDRLLDAAYVLSRAERRGSDGSLLFLKTADQIIWEILNVAPKRMPDKPARSSAREAKKENSHE